jgi:hypothetical protein
MPGWRWNSAPDLRRKLRNGGNFDINLAFLVKETHTLRSRWGFGYDETYQVRL